MTEGFSFSGASPIWNVPNAAHFVATLYLLPETALTSIRKITPRLICRLRTTRSANKCYAVFFDNWKALAGSAFSTWEPETVYWSNSLAIRVGRQKAQNYLVNFGRWPVHDMECTFMIHRRKKFCPAPMTG
jgi:hypothetical protein